MTRIQAAIVFLAAVLAGCSDTTTSGTGTPAPTTTTVTTPAPTTTTTSESAPPPSTHATVPPLPGGKTIDANLCFPAQDDMQSEAKAFHVAVAKYPDSGRSIPASAWAEAEEFANGIYAARPAQQRDMLIAAGIPESHPAIQDIDDFLAAVTEEKAAIQVRDEAAVLPIWQRLDSAVRRFVQACGVLAPN